MRFIWIIALTICFSITHSHAQVAQWGRDLEDRQTFSVGLSFGSVLDLEGEVQETTRPIEVIGGPTSGAPPEDYSWEELGFDDRFAVGGISLEKMWRFVTLGGFFMRGNPKVRNTADRDYYIGVGEVRFQGRSYDYLMIPEGTTYSGDIDLLTSGIHLLITPVTFGSSSTLSFTPWLHLGLFGFLADYEIDAGLPTEVTQYENPPRDYVVGGRATGYTGLLVPELGGGGEIRISFSSRMHLSLQAHAAFLSMSGSNRDFAVSSRNEKSVSVDYRSIGARAMLEWELNEHVNLLTGLTYLHWQGDAEVRATDKPEEAVLALREKFDKDVHFESSMWTVFVGLRF